VLRTNQVGVFLKHGNNPIGGLGGTGNNNVARYLNATDAVQPSSKPLLAEPHKLATDAQVVESNTNEVGEPANIAGMYTGPAKLEVVDEPMDLE
jgi:hypothetical protein